MEDRIKKDLKVPIEAQVEEKDQDNEPTDIQVVHIAVGPREYVAEMDMLLAYPDGGEIRLQNAVLVHYQDIPIKEGEKKTKTIRLLLNLQETHQYTGEVIIWPGQILVFITPLDEKGNLYKEYSKIFSVIIEPPGSKLIPGPGGGMIPPFPHGN